jgi:FKBP-type peptidyl-prolyl cis-trans isomerase FkpA
MRFLLLALPAVLLAQAPSPNPTPRPAAANPAALVPVTEDEKTIYSLGLFMYRSLAQFDLSPAEFELFKQALSDAAAGKPTPDLNAWNAKFKALSDARSARLAEREKAAGAGYQAKAAAQPGAVTTPTGLVYRELTAGAGASPKTSDTVKVNYRGALIDGTEFDSSYSRNEPAQFPLLGVIPCWTEGLQRMKVGGKAQLVCPAALAYGDHGRPPAIPAGATLVFEIELLDIVAPAQH